MSKSSKTPFDLKVFGAPFATSSTPVPGARLVDLRSLGMIPPIAGGARGYNASADVLTQSADGRDLNEIWNEFQATVAIQNEERQRLIDLLTFPVNSPIEDVVQFGGGDFEKASEYGRPQGIRPTNDVFSLGYTFDWYDISTRFTWQFLAEASSSQIEASHQSVLEADNRLVFMEVMRTLFRSDNREANIKGQNYTVFTFWNGDGTVPPPYKNNTFDGSYSHFRTSGANTVDSEDLDEVSAAFKSHGYSAENGVQQFVLVNTAEANVIRTFRVANGDMYDFIPASGQPASILSVDERVVGSQPSSAYRGLNVIGSYGNILVIEEDYIPAGYVAAFASGGQANLNNPIGFREHANASLRGLSLVKGRDNDYPLIDSYYVRGFGTGVRQRGAGLILQITSSATYTAPPAYSD